jgi:hypothetical protein
MILDYIFTIIGIIIAIIIITILSSIFPKFILGIIIILFIIVFILNIHELIKYTNKNVLVKSEGGNIANYCNLAKYKIFDYDILVDNGNLTLFTLYLILFILFWSNKIANDILNNSSNSEIKILGFYKYYNKDVYKNYNYEYECIYAIMLFIALSTIIYGLNLIYYNFSGLNKKENEVIENINIIGTLLKDNINISYLNFCLKQLDEKKKIDDEDFITNYINYIKQDTPSDKYKQEAYDLYNSNINKFYIKCHITYILFNIESKNVIDKNIVDKLNDSTGNYCIFDLISDKNVDAIFPTNMEINRDIIVKDNKLHEIEIDTKKINDMYINFVSTLKTNYYNVRKYEKGNLFYYKIDLLFTKFSGVLFSIFAIIFLIKTEFKQIIKNLFNITIDPLEYTIYNYGNIFKIIIIITILLFISILFNS